MEVALRSGGSAGRFPVNPGGKSWRPSPITSRADPRGSATPIVLGRCSRGRRRPRSGRRRPPCDHRGTPLRLGPIRMRIGYWGSEVDSWIRAAMTDEWGANTSGTPTALSPDGSTRNWFTTASRFGAAPLAGPRGASRLRPNAATVPLRRGSVQRTERWRRWWWPANCDPVRKETWPSQAQRWTRVSSRAVLSWSTWWRTDGAVIAASIVVRDARTSP